MPSKEFAAQMYQAMYKGESTSAAADMGRTLVSKGDMLVIESFLQDRPPPFVDVEQEEAEIRIGEKSDFKWDLTTDGDRADEIITGPRFGGVTWPDPPPEEETDPEDEEFDTVINVQINESNREIETIRVMGSDGESYVDIQRITSITFQMPDKRGPNGTIREYWTYNLNWDDPVIGGVRVSDLDLAPGDTIIDVEEAP